MSKFVSYIMKCVSRNVHVTAAVTLNGKIEVYRTEPLFRYYTHNNDDES